MNEADPSATRHFSLARHVFKMIVASLLVLAGLWMTACQPSWRDLTLSQTIHRHLAATNATPITGSHPFTVASPVVRGKAVINLAHFGLVAGRPAAHRHSVNNIAAINRAMMYCRAHDVGRVLVPKGTYYMTGAGSIRIARLANCIFDGQNATFIFTNLKGGPAFRIQHCHRILLTHLFIDWDWKKHPLAFDGRLTAMGPCGSWGQMTFPFCKHVSADQFLCRTMNPLDPNTRFPGAGKEIATRGVRHVFAINSNTLRFIPDRPLVDATVGRLYRVRNYTYQKPCFALTSNDNLTLAHITIYSFPGAGYVINGDQHNWRLLHCDITLSPAHWRPITTTADAYHVNESKGNMRLSYCDYGYQGDDGINIHDNISQGWRRIDAHTILACHVRPGRNRFHPGDRIEFRDPNLSPTHVELKLTRVRYHPRQSTCELTFASAVPGGIPTDAILFNRRYHSNNYIIEHCRFHDNRARGILVKTADGLIQHCQFTHTQQEAIQINVDIFAGLWAEGTGARNLIVRDNTFRDINYQARRGGIAIWVGTHLDHGIQTGYPIHRGLLFQANRMVDFPGPAFYLASCRHVTIRRNIITNLSAVPNAKLDRGMIVARDATGLTIVGNEWKRKSYDHRSVFRYDTASVQRMEFRRNHR